MSKEWWRMPKRRATSSRVKFPLERESQQAGCSGFDSTNGEAMRRFLERRALGGGLFARSELHGGRGLWRAVAQREMRVNLRSWRRLDALQVRNSRLVHAPAEPSDITLVDQTLKIASLITAFRSRGHFVASLDPLGRTLGLLVEGNEEAEYSEPENAKDLFELLKDYPSFNLDAVLCRRPSAHVTGLAAVLDSERVVAMLRVSYCSTTTVEHEHVISKTGKDWIRLMVECPQARSLFLPSFQRRILYHLLYADHFEPFLATKFQASKRFGIEGCESLIPGLFALIEHAAENGIKAIELGMSHRSRLIVLHTILSKPLGSIITEFKNAGDHLQLGDVKYHVGTRGALSFTDKMVQISLLPNPSHLEAVDPVVLGKTRAKQFFTGGTKRSQNMGLLLHGDAAFSGLGLVAEVMQVCASKLADMATGTYFRRVTADGDAADNLRNTFDLLPRKEIQILLLCSGKIFYLLRNARRSRKMRNVAILRLEQIAPFPFDRVASIINRYPNAQLTWVQEEPKNVGAWAYVQPRLATALRELCRGREHTDVRFIGRATSATTATGSFQVRQMEMKAIINAAFELEHTEVHETRNARHATPRLSIHKL